MKPFKLGNPHSYNYDIKDHDGYSLVVKYSKGFSLKEVTIECSGWGQSCDFTINKKDELIALRDYLNKCIEKYE